MVKTRRRMGYGFPDEVIKATFKGPKLRNNALWEDWKDLLVPNFDALSPQESKVSIWRITIFLTVTLIAFFIIFIRIFHLQIVEGGVSRELADSNRIQIKVIHAPRGVIYDRNGKILATSSPAFRLNDSEIKKTRLITREEALELEVKNDPRAKDLEVDNIRTYPMSQILAHVLGYVGGDGIGKMGIEAQYESLLKGVDGGEVIEVDSKGVKVRVLRRNGPKPGQSIYLTIDSDLSKKLYELIVDTISKVGACCGAAVAMDPKNGEILALLSFPSFDPNIFTLGFDEGTILETLSDPSFPILNRVIAGTYPPGSTFKVVTALAALSSGVSADTIIEDSGEFYLGTFRFSNWYFNQYGKKEGSLDLVKAIQRSNDTYFYRVSQTIGEQAIADWARRLKLGSKLNIDIPGEEAGLVPDDKWKREKLGEVWYPGDTLHMGIGQGFILTTPLQILGITSFIASDGKILRPQLLSKVTRDNVITKQFKEDLLVSELQLKQKIEKIAEGLKKVPKQGGTAWPFFSFPIETAGKTGTAEYGDPKGRTHAWYTSYAPVSDPKIALTILIEGGGEGSSVASPIAKEAYRWYFSPDKNNLIKDVYPIATESARTLGE
ncbi:MAG: penicillin-binding transpeptidase domain-containing protein [Patescibacteria group bacterium]